MKLKYVLPVLQMALAAMSLWWKDSLESVAARMCDSPGPNPALELSWSINGPMISILGLSERFLFPFNLTTIAVVGLFWYWVLANVFSLRRGAGLAMPSWRPARLLLDLLFIFMSFPLGIEGAFQARRALLFGTVSCYGTDYLLGWPESMTVACLYLGWALVLIYFCGRDFVQCVRPRRSN